MNKRYGLVTGSFDPITVGHVDIIERAAKIFERVTVLVANNEEKHYMFSSEERAQIAKASIAHIPNADVMVCDGFVADFAREHGANAFVRGIRDGNDVAYEQNMADINFANCGVDTVLLFAKPEFHKISSTSVREKITVGELRDAKVNDGARKEIINILAKR